MHGFEQEWCSFCKERTEIQNTYFEPQLISKFDNNEQYGLVLSNPDTTGMVNVMWLSVNDHFERMNKEFTDIQYVKQQPIFEQNRIKQGFRSIAIDKGSLFIPRHPLTRRERSEIGDTHCWQCKSKLSYVRGTIGCYRCGQYACICGHCMCDFPGGVNYLGQYIPPRKSSPFNNETRREYVKIVKAFSNLN